MFALALRSALAVVVTLTSATALHAQATAQQPTQEIKSWIAIRQQRVDLLRDEAKQSDSRLEARLDVIIETLRSIGDSKDSGTKVARMKEDTGKRLMKTIEYYDQKRQALKEELRSPRLHLTVEEKRKLIAIFDERIQKRTQQIIALHKSMPTHKDYERYSATGGGWYGTDYRRNENYEQNQRLTSKSNTQRDAIIKQLEITIGRLERQSRTLKTQIAATNDLLQRKTLNEELNKNEAFIAERRKQKLEVLKPSATPTRNVGLKEAMDMDKALQTAIVELRREFTTLFGQYNTFLGELSLLHATEAMLASARR